MAVIETWLKQDLKKPVQVKELGGHLFSADNMANLIGVEVFSDGSPATLSGGVIGYAVRADGATVVVNGTLSDNKATVTLPASCYAVVGPISIVIKVGTTTVGACTGYVYRSSTDEIIDPGHVVPSLQELLAQIQNCIDATASANTAAGTANTAAQTANTAAQNVGSIVARPYSSSSTYVAGDYCTNNGNLYKANQDISTAEEWTASHWSQIVMGDEVTGLKSAIIAIPDLTGKVITQHFIHGGTGAETSGYYYNCTDYIDISNSINGASVFCYCALASNAGVAFYDANKVFISGVSGNTAEASGYTTGTEKRAFVIPPKAKYFRASLNVGSYTSASDFDISFINLPGVQEDLLQSIKKDEFEEYQSNVGALINIHGTVGVANTQQTIGSFRVINGHKYKLKATVQSGLNYNVYVYFKHGNTVIGSINLANGITEKEIEITASANGICNVLANPSSSVSTSVNVDIFDESGTIGVLETTTEKNTLNIGNLNGYQYNIEFEQGAIGGTGSDYSSTTDIRTGFVPLVSGKYHVAINTQNGHAYALFYDSTKAWISGKNIWNKTSDFDFEISDNDTAKYVRFVVNIGGSSITPTDNAVILSIIGVYKDIKEIIDITPIVPDYFMANDYLNDKVTEIIENCVVKSGTSFAFITDLHLEDNSGSSKSVLKYIMDNAPVPFIISGGDIPTAYSAVSGNEKAEVIKDAQEWLKWVTYWGQDRVYQLRGNHDYVKPSRTDNTKYYNMQNGGVHQLVMSKFEMKVHAPNPEMNYYYYDDDNQKIRYVVIDGHTYNSSYPSVVVSWVFQDQLQWIADALLSADGYSVVVISHETYNPTMTGYSSNLEDVGNLVGAFKSKGVFHKTYYEHGDVDADFTNSTAELVCFLSGHSHVDESDVDDNGVLCISTTCDARYGSGRTLGTITESAFDVFSIDTTDKTIKTIRVGYGENRGWNYVTGEEIE